MSDRSGRWAWAEVDLGAIRHNVGVLSGVVAPAALWAVVKADGYGHGAVAVARAALAAGAEGLCVALAEEGVALRRAGIEAPILLLSEQPIEQTVTVVEQRLIPTVYRAATIDALAAAVAASVGSGSGSGVGVHLKIDTGMQRVGVGPAHAAEVASRVAAHHPVLRLDGVFTHLAIADQPDDPFTAEQLRRFDAALAGLPAVQHVHAANSAGGLAHPAARRSLVRAGIAIYGLSPGAGVEHLCRDLRPALSLLARVSFVKRVAAGSRISYGLRHTFDRETTVATVPIGYADGVPRRLSATGGEVLLGGGRRPIVGVVTMDQLMIDCGDDAVEVGDEVVLLGAQGGERITADDWARRLGTIGYEIVCGIGGRIERRSIGA